MESFTSVLQSRFKSFENLEKIEDSTAKNQDFQDVENFKKGFNKLEGDYQLAIQRTEDLEKYNLNLQEQLSRYGILLSEQKAETKDALVKYDTLQKEFHEKVESLFREKSLFEKRYFLILGLFILTILFLIAVLIFFYPQQII